MQINPRYKQMLLDLIYQQFPTVKVYLFGSRATNTHQEGADVDIALNTGKVIDMNQIYDLKAKIEESTIPLFVDIVDLTSAPDKLKSEIQREGILWKN